LDACVVGVVVAGCCRNRILKRKQANESHPACMLNLLQVEQLAMELEQALKMAAREAAIQDGISLDSLGGNGGLDASAKLDVRRGKWTEEEEMYALRLIAEFKEGTLPLAEGTTLRTFLSKLLRCDPMRISKKFVGNNSIGKVTLDLELR
jgi:hypothetical protein